MPDYLPEEGLTEFQQRLQRALSELPHRPSDMTDLARVRTGLRDVLISHLNYELADEHVAGLPDDVEDPRIVADRNGFNVVHLHLPRLRASVERPAVERVRRTHPQSLIVCTSVDPLDEGAWHFVNVKDAGQGRNVLRRAVLEPPAVGRTVLETLSQCEVKSGSSALEIQIAQDRAFDVEAVSKKFYKAYAENFIALRDELQRLHVAARETADGAVQELLNRLVFLMFIQRKRWLPTPENPQLDFLWDEFRQSHRSQPDSHSFHKDFLHPLFIALSRRKETNYRRGLPAEVRQAPFLNGGLFDIDDEAEALTLSNGAFEALFHDLFLRYNFTIREDTPLEVEVAIDPEMMGRVFENLILQIEKTGEVDPRKATGSYYTPRPIVHFMCQQALREWIAGQHIVSTEALDKLFALLQSELAGSQGRAELGNLLSSADAERLRGRLMEMAIVDPAVGSGAFLVGMLHELLSVLRLIDLLLKGPDEIDRRNYDYDNKRKIIERCLYGVDIQARAVRICELRLWLSLVVDYTLAGGEAPPTLPNLTYRVVQGDSLIEHLLGNEVRWVGEPANDRERQLVDAIQTEKGDHFFKDDPQEKHRLEVSIIRHTAELAREILSRRDRETQMELGATASPLARDPLLDEIEGVIQKADRLSKKASVGAKDVSRLRALMRQTFVWRLDFAEVFKRRGGFDVAIENPPYGAKFEPEVRAALVRRLPAHDSTKNSASFFIELSFGLVRADGVCCLIVPKSLTFSEGWRPSRQLLLQYDLLALADVSEAFEDVLLEQVILVAAKRHSQTGFRGYTIDKGASIIPISSVGRATADRLDTLPVYIDKTMFRIFGRLSGSGAQMHQVADIFRGLPWQSRVVHSDDGEVILRGRDVQLYAVLPTSARVSLTQAECQLPKVVRLRRPKVIAQQIVAHVRKPVDHILVMAACDYEGVVTMDTVENIVPRTDVYPLEYCVALLNSAFARWFYYWFVYNRAVRTMHFDEYYVGKLPVPAPDGGMLRRIQDLVQNITHSVAGSPSTSLVGKAHDAQRELDSMIFHLYGLTKSEAKMVLSSVGAE